MSMLMRSIPLTAMAAVGLLAQTPTSVSQTSKGSCSPNVISGGTVTITCTGVDAILLEKFVRLLNQVLQSVSALDTLSDRLDQLLARQERTVRQMELVGINVEQIVDSLRKDRQETTVHHQFGVAPGLRANTLMASVRPAGFPGPPAIRVGDACWHPRLGSATLICLPPSEP